MVIRAVFRVESNGSSGISQNELCFDVFDVIRTCYEFCSSSTCDVMMVRCNNTSGRGDDGRGSLWDCLFDRWSFGIIFS